MIAHTVLRGDLGPMMIGRSAMSHTLPTFTAGAQYRKCSHRRRPPFSNPEPYDGGQQSVSKASSSLLVCLQRKLCRRSEPNCCIGRTPKAKALAAALAQIEKQFGKGTIMRLGEGEAIEDIQVVSTGSLGLDVALGVGGLPRGRVIEIYGPESSGKTTLTLQVIAEMQKQGGTCAFVDAEHALDVQYAQNPSADAHNVCYPRGVRISAIWSPTGKTFATASGPSR